MEVVCVIDASGVITESILSVSYNKGYITESVVEELKCEKSRRWLIINSAKLEVRNPKEEYIEEVESKAQEMECSLLSKQDLEVAALSLELTRELKSDLSSWIGPLSLPEARVICVTADKTLKSFLAKYNIPNYDGLGNSERKFLQRCFTCKSIYKEDRKIIFCGKCGYSTVSRVSYTTDESGQIELHLRKEYLYKEKKIFHKGREIKSKDQKEYRRYEVAQKKEEKNSKKHLKYAVEDLNYEVD